MSNRELQPWGGDVRVPQWLRRVFRRGDAGDSPERAAEARHDAHRAKHPDVSVAENADRAIFGGWSEGHPGNRDRPRGQ
jgi:hypothetical protein